MQHRSPSTVHGWDPTWRPRLLPAPPPHTPRPPPFSPLLAPPRQHVAAPLAALPQPSRLSARRTKR
eukprot:2244236-Prymnesium_polylepis.2